MPTLDLSSRGRKRDVRTFSFLLQFKFACRAWGLRSLGVRIVGHRRERLGCCCCGQDLAGWQVLERMRQGSRGRSGTGQ